MGRLIDSFVCRLWSLPSLTLHLASTQSPYLLIRSVLYLFSLSVCVSLPPFVCLSLLLLPQKDRSALYLCLSLSRSYCLSHSTISLSLWRFMNGNADQ